MAGTARVRMTRDNRREQLLDLGVQLMATRSLDEISIDLLAEEAGISRGLLYHYFGNKQDFHVAVVRRAADELYAVTAPDPDGGSPLERLSGSLARYVDFVRDNYRGYVSLLRGAAGGSEEMRAIYEESRAALTGRFFESGVAEESATYGMVDTPAVRLLVRGWSALVEETTVAWVQDPGDLTREDLLEVLTAALPNLVGSLGRT